MRKAKNVIKLRERECRSLCSCVITLHNFEASTDLNTYGGMNEPHSM